MSTENHHIAKAMYVKADNRFHRAESPPTVSSHRVWITPSVVKELSQMVTTMVARASSESAKADNRVHFADKRRIVWSKWSWIHRMPSVVDLTASVNGEYSVLF